MKQFLAKDSALKVISVLIAITIWIYIIIVIDPSVEVTVRDIPIQFAGEEQLLENGLSVVSESASTVTVTVRGSRKRMGSYDMRDVIARVDMSDIRTEGTTTLPIDVVIPFEHDSVSSKTPYSVDIVTEKNVEKTLDIEVQTSNHLADGFMPGDITVEPETITIEGAESVVEMINRAAVTLDYASADVDIDVESSVQLYGVDGAEITERDVLAARISKSVETAKIHCPVLRIKTVNVNLNFDLNNAWDFDQSRYSANPETVSIYGDNGVTANIDAIQTEPISLEQFNDTEKIKVKLIIPEGVKVMDDITEVEVVENNNP